MEKEARQWRQIYKAYHILLLWLVFLSLIVVFNLQALQLLEYLIKHGSERVVDDARSHLSTIKMLRSFHYIDEKGKDQGINGSVFHLLTFSPTTFLLHSAKSLKRAGRTSRRRRQDSPGTQKGQGQPIQVRWYR
jgi:hypothetical protein